LQLINISIYIFYVKKNDKYLQVKKRLLIQIIYFIVTNVSKETSFIVVNRNKLNHILVSAIYVIITKSNSGIL